MSSADHDYRTDEGQNAGASASDDIDHLITDEIDWVDKLMTGEIEPQSPARKKPRTKGTEQVSPPRIEPDTSYFCKKCTDELQRPVEVVGKLRDEHVWGHVGTTLDDAVMFFACRFCEDFQCRTEENLLAHMNHLHKNRKPRLGVDFDSLRSQFKEEFEVSISSNSMKFKLAN